MPTTSLKPKACAFCETRFTPVRPLQAVCSPRCARRKVEAARKEEKATTRARKAALKTRQEWLAECQAIVNKYVRLRDRSLGCCSCDRPATWDGQWHASHLRSVGAASAVRFNLWNIAKSCSICNNHLSGNLAEYLPRARARWGNERVDWLFAQNKLVRYEIAYLQRLKAVMSKKVRRLEKRL